MTLGELIEELEKADPNRVLPDGFIRPHSYRGDYCDLAFVPKSNVPIGVMLANAKSALGQTYDGYKGGDFLMDEYTSVHLANYGQTGEEIGPLLLRLMLNQPTPTEPAPAAGAEEK